MKTTADLNKLNFEIKKILVIFKDRLKGYPKYLNLKSFKF
jgi:hypothetical protein